jgi:murein DD-endopeptidase MepM/ murein hydrolase activator NlpD
MIISPPFLPERAAGTSEDAWLDSAMVAPASRLADTQAPEGSFPLSYNLAWHNGMHLQAPQASGSYLPVRAVADGTVVFASKPKARNAEAGDAQNYNPFVRSGTEAPAWTDNGCVVIEHRTTIGANGAAETEVAFYSVYMHLSELGRITPAGQTSKRFLQAGDAIWRKDEVGKPGKVYGHDGQIHFEICMDADNLHKLIGRAPNWVEPAGAPATPAAPTADGREDTLFGSMYFYLPANTPTASGATRPASNLRRPEAQAGSTLGTPVWVKMTYDCGTCQFTTLDERGRQIAELAAMADVEYDLFKEATDRHAALPPAEQTHSSPSGWYELLRFGRNIGRGPNATDKDPLPANAAHWRRIAGPDGHAVWADLNAQGSFKFSDADFLPVLGWNCIDDDTSPSGTLTLATRTAWSLLN